MPIRPATHRARGMARRQAVLDAAVDVISERGLEGTTHRSVAERARVPLSTTSYFFASLDELIAEAIRNIAARLVTAAEAVIGTAAEDGLDRAELAGRLVELLTESPARDVVVQLEAYLACGRRPELREPVRQIMRGYQDMVEAALRTAGVADAAPIAGQFLAVVDGFALHRMAWPRGDTDRAALAMVLHRLLDSYLDQERARGQERDRNTGGAAAGG